MSKLENKIALVTGGNRNIGRETALALAADGADVIITYRSRAEDAAQTVADIEALGRKAAAVQLDLSGTGEIADFVETVKGQLGHWGRQDFDILVNNAGILGDQMFGQVEEAALDRVYSTNYKGVFMLTQALDPLLAEGGRVVLISSGTAQVAFAPLVSYGPLKAAIESLTPYLAKHFGGRGITVNAVAPGGLDDEFNAELFDRMPQARDYLRGNTALGRIGMPEDVAGVIAFLASPAAGFVSGAVIPVDGGYHL
ncbi:SDR family NAD(P)-dependent oxidoreductase [Pontivivens ytuae]|nr:SDR family oxidoreductase [Pontivivens ytuae]